MTTYLEILFRDNVHEIDLDIIKPATPQQPGQAKINQAKLKNNATFRVQDAVSWTGLKFGFAVKGEELLPPFQDTYQLIEDELPEGELSDQQSSQEKLPEGAS